jgi:hypothetical protein
MDGFRLYDEIKKKDQKPKSVFLPQVNCIIMNLDKENMMR